MATDGLYIQLFSVHGLLRAENMELGRDADTGGQIRYVVELGRALGKQPGVRRVDLFTRRIDDPALSADYARPVEEVGDQFRIVRIPCGGDDYIRKELLWPHLDEFIEGTIRFTEELGDVPDIVHGHYPDAGYVAGQLSEIHDVPMIYTGHSMGRSKLKRLLGEGMSEEEIIERYKIDYRIQMEEEALRKATLVVTSTHQEESEQYAPYKARNFPSYVVIPPGLDTERFYPYYHDVLPGASNSEGQRYARASVLQELNRFFIHPDKPLILSICRPDVRKNIGGLIEAFGEDKELQAMANLAVFAGLRKDITVMEENEREVLTEILLLMDKFDLYGKLAIPKKHDVEYEVPEMYRIAADKRGVFVNPALTEPFGITLIESAACGLPIIAPDDGGPRDIIENCDNGILVNTRNPKEIASAAKRIISDDDQWEKYSQSGLTCVPKHYTWESHAKSFVEAIGTVLTKSKSHAAENDTNRLSAVDAA